MENNKNIVEKMYKIFSDYPSANDFCTFCYSEKKIEYYKSTPLKDIDIDSSRVLLWETADHWESTDVYKHYLPRLLEIMLPPINEEDMYPGHILETLKFHNFQEWQIKEKLSVIEVLNEAKKYFYNYDDEDYQYWNELYDELVMD